VRRLLAPVVAAVVVVLSAMACAQISAEVTTVRALERAGYDGVDVRANTVAGERTVAVRWTTRAADRPSLAQEFAGVRRLVWTTAPVDIDTMQLTAEGPAPALGAPSLTQSVRRRELTQELGPRPAGLVAHRAARRLRWLVIAAVLAVLGGLIGAVVVMGRSHLRSDEGV
jgi:hypothetical protein